MAHDVSTLVGQRLLGSSLQDLPVLSVSCGDRIDGLQAIDGDKGLVDHDELRHDMDVALGRLEARHGRCAALAGESTLNRLEHGTAVIDRYRRIAHGPPLIERSFIHLFLDAHAKPPTAIVLDRDATDDPLHGHQEGRFLHGCDDCHCYLPRSVSCCRHLLVAKLRRSSIDASAGAVEEVERIVVRIRERWRRVRIILRADSFFARESLMR